MGLSYEANPRLNHTLLPRGVIVRPRRSKYQLSVSGRRSLTPPILDGKAIFKNSIFAGAIKDRFIRRVYVNGRGLMDCEVPTLWIAD